MWPHGYHHNGFMATPALVRESKRDTLRCVETGAHVLTVCFLRILREFSVYNPGALFRKSLSDNIDFLTSAPGVVYGKGIEQ